jgi:ATP-binding cassette, subfamily B, bacterial HlyB/CyaB
MIQTEASTAATQHDADPRPLGQAAMGNWSASVSHATIQPMQSAGRLDSGLTSLSLIAGYYRIAADPAQLRHQLALTGRLAQKEDLLRAANLLQLKSRAIGRVDAKRLGAIPYPAIIELKDGGFAVLAVSADKGRIRLIDPIARSAKEVSLDEAEALSSGSVILVTRRLGGAGTDPNSFGFRWFWPSILRYRQPLTHVLVASLFVQLFALASPLFFQLVVDKVLVHKGTSTLVVLIVGMVALGFFETVLQFLRSYTLSHTTNRIDVELGRRLFHHLFRCRSPISKRARLDRRSRACANWSRSAAF